MKFLDTSFLIDVRRKNPNVKSIIEELDKGVIHITNTIVVHEFLTGGYGSRSPKELEERKKLLDKFVIVPFDYRSSEVSAKLESELRKKGELIGTADIIIAATMITNNVKDILTRNVKHFEKIKEINIITWDK